MKNYYFMLIIINILLTNHLSMTMDQSKYNKKIAKYKEIAIRFLNQQPDNWKRIQIFLKNAEEVDPNFLFNKHGDSLLHLAVKSDQYTITEELIKQYGMNPNIQNKVTYNTPLHDVIALIKQNHQNEQQTNNLKKFIVLLKTNGAHHEIKNNNGETALDLSFDGIKYGPYFEMKGLLESLSKK